MSDHSWGEIFNLNEELRKIEEEVDRRLEETLAEDPHVIEQETVHYGSPENYRMHQSMPSYEAPVEAVPATPVPEPVEEPAEEIAEAPAVEEVSAEEEAPAVEEVLSEEETPAAPAEVIAFPVSEEAEEPTEAPVEEVAEETVETSVEEEVPAEEEMSVEEPAEEIAEAPAEEAAPVEKETPAEEEVPVEEETPAEEEAPAEEAPAEEEIPAEEEAPAVEEAPVEEEAPAVEETPPAVEAPVVEEQPTTELPTPKAQGSKMRILGILLGVIAVLILALAIPSMQNRSRIKQQYEAAQALLDAGDYDGAISSFTAIQDYQDSAERIMEAQYAKASALVEAGSYEEAIDYIDGLSNPSDAMQNLRESANNQRLEALYQQASDALAIYDFDAAEPILEELGDYEDAPVLLQQVQNAVDIVYTDVARDDDGVEIAGKTEYLWVHSVITPGAIAAGSSSEEVIAALRQMGEATDDIDDDWVKVLMMHQATTDAEMLYIDADPIKTDKADVITMDISQYAGIDETFGEDQMIYAPQTLQRSNTDFTFAFDGAQAYAGEDREDDTVRMECKMADDGYWVKTRRVYDEMEDGKLVGVPQHQLRTWTKVTTESVADEVRDAFLSYISKN